MNIEKLLSTESKLITMFFKQNGIYAVVTQEDSVFRDPTAGFIRYALRLRYDQSFAAIERVERELSAVISRGRARHNLPSPITAIPISVPIFGIEVPHPAAQALLWSMRKTTIQQPHAMLLGQSYMGVKNKDEKEAQEESLSFTNSGSCHVLVVGITGAGKTVLMQSMLLSLTANTSPEDLKIVLVDLKNEDLLPFRNLPHVLTFAGTREQAIDAIDYVVAEKEKRVAQVGYKPFRLVLWVDEMAQLASVKGVAESLGDLASIGRGKLINLVGATQHPTNDGGLGSLLKANFPARLVGMVAPGQSYIATGRKELHADLLPGNGAFLRLQGPMVKRFQSFNIEENDVQLMSNFIADNWRKAGYKAGASGYGVGSVSGASGFSSVPQPDIAGYGTGYDRIHTSGGAAQEISGYSSEIFPVRSGRALTENEAQAVRQLAESGDFDTSGKLSLNKLTIHVYGSKDPARTNWIKEAIAEVKI